jgi:hypothetical protein
MNARRHRKTFVSFVSSVSAGSDVAGKPLSVLSVPDPPGILENNMASRDNQIR